MAQTSDTPETDALQKRITDLERQIKALETRLQRRDEIKADRDAARRTRDMRKSFTLGMSWLIAAAIVFFGIRSLQENFHGQHARTEIERTKAETERQRLQAEIAAQEKRLKIETENAEFERKVQSLRLLNGILSGPGTPAEKKAAVQLLLDLKFDLGEVSKAPGKVLDLIDRGVKTVGTIAEVVKNLVDAGDARSPKGACCEVPRSPVACCPPCIRTPPPGPTPPKPPPKKGDCGPGSGAGTSKSGK